MVSVYAAIYEYDDEGAGGRERLLADHRGWLSELKAAGRLLEAGVLSERPGSIIVVLADSPEEAVRTFDGDPFHRAGLIAGRSVSAWQVRWGVVADAAAAAEAA
jgi:uncharacterized protein YciI